jgi:GNAT superfamily N-acetyltransferase
VTAHFALDQSIRRLAERDIPAALALSSFAGWNQTADDWRLLLQPGVGECLAIDCDGRLVATTTLVCYGPELAWLGMVLTHPGFRKRGLARRLVEAALGIAEKKRIGTVKLDATELGLPLYHSFGFREQQTIMRWSGTGGVASNIDRVIPLATLPFELDRQAFGADRKAILERLAGGGATLIAEDGFAMLRPGARASHFGPCIARSAESARRLIHSCLRTSRGECYWDVLAANRAAVNLANELRFKQERVLVRMVKGVDTQVDESLIYAGGGFEIG